MGSLKLALQALAEIGPEEGATALPAVQSPYSPAKEANKAKEGPSETGSSYPTDPAELLAYLRSMRIDLDLSPKGPDFIHYRVPAEGSVPENVLVALLKRHKPALLALLRAEKAPEGRS